jgi:hypothetical protein
MPIVRVPGTDIDYHLISFDGSGVERTDDPDGTMSDRIVDAITAGAVTDVFVLSHGWMGDIPAARSQYNRWIGAMAAADGDRQRMREARPGYRSLIVGFHWPSEPFGEEDFEDVAFAIGGTTIDDEVERWAARLADTPAAREALATIFAAAVEDSVPQTLPQEVVDAYAVLDREAGLASEGPGAAPGRDREAFDPETAFQESFDEGFGLFGISLGGLLAPLKQLSFWRMKGRARSVGEGGGHDLFERILATGPDVRVHLMGHSFGCIVVTSMVAGPADGNGPSRPASSMALVQGATSHWAYCSDIPHDPGRAGYFHRLVARGDVAGPVVVTTSGHDRALAWWYPKAAGLAGQVDFVPGRPGKYGAIGIAGIQGPGVDVTTRPIGAADAIYGFAPGKVYNLTCDDVIDEGNFFSGAHSDIAHPEIARAVWEAAITAP